METIRGILEALTFLLGLALLLIGPWLVINVSWWLGMVVHEMGHFVACLPAGWKPLLINFGRNRSIPLLRFGGATFRLGLGSNGGYVIAVPKNRKHYRLKMAIFVAGGPAATAMLMTASFALAKTMDARGLDWQYSVPPMVFGAIQAWMLVTNLFPCRTKSAASGGQGSSDGLVLWHLLTANTEWLDKSYAGFSHIAMISCLQDGKAEEAHAVFEQFRAQLRQPYGEEVWGYILFSLGYREEARKEITARLSQPFESDEKKAEFLDLLACIPIYTSNTDILDEAFRYVEESLAVAPGRITSKGTKGSLLIEKGCVDEGIALLEEVLEKSEAKNDIATSQYYLALAYHKKGDSQRAREYLKQAQATYPDCNVHERVENDLAGIARPKVTQAMRLEMLFS